MTFGQKVKSLRQELGYTQEELAEKVRTTQPYVSRLENGGFNPSMPMIISIAVALRVSADYLLFDGGENA
ncbi:MAG: helix-turn-helix domain-containing protein [Ruminococcus flavefaciens]|nr:helix-turn-helix domain-containing protein [Ruminococcus flavefaciens]